MTYYIVTYIIWQKTLTAIFNIVVVILEYLDDPNQFCLSSKGQFVDTEANFLGGTIGSQDCQHMYHL